MAIICKEVEISKGQIETVDFEADCSWEDNSFSYAGTHCTGGRSGVHYEPPTPICDGEITWDKDLYSEEQNAAIKQFVEENNESLAEDLAKEFANSYDPSDDEPYED